MAGIFGSGLSQMTQQNQYANPSLFGNSYIPQNNQGNSIQVYSVQEKSQAENFNLMPNTTAVFMNYNGRKFWIKTEHANGMSYDLEELIFFTPQELEMYNQQLQQSAPQAQPIVDYVPRAEFDELKKMIEDFMK